MAKKKYDTIEVTSYDKWLTLKKVLIQAGIIGVVAFATDLSDNGMVDLIQAYPEYMVYLVTISAILIGLLNWWKHHNDTETVKVDI